MATVMLRAALPSVRIGLAAMLAEQGHTPRFADTEESTDADADAPGVVWVVDNPDAAALDSLLAARYTDHPRAAVVLADDPSLATRLAHAGLRGWALLGRDSDSGDLDLAVRAADGGLALLDLPAAASALPSMTAASLPPRPPAEPLTPREMQVLQLVAQGLPNKGIARALAISENTAKFHVASVCAKLGASGRTEAVTLAARQGLLLL